MIRVSRGLCSSTTNSFTTPMTFWAQSSHQPASTRRSQNARFGPALVKFGSSGEPTSCCNNKVSMTKIARLQIPRSQSGQDGRSRATINTRDNSNNERIKGSSGSIFMMLIMCGAPLCGAGYIGKHRVSIKSRSSALVLSFFAVPCGNQKTKMANPLEQCLGLRHDHAMPLETEERRLSCPGPVSPHMLNPACHG